MSTNPPRIKIYRASPTLSKFHLDDAFVRALIGPFGSGKSVACVSELLKRAYTQKEDDENRRRTKWAIVRNTYRELLDTTSATFFNWIPEELGNFNRSTMVFTLNVILPDYTRLHAEFLFRALDRPADIKKLLSLDLTGGWINEAREIPKAVVEALQGRCGRYPETVLDFTDPRYITDPRNCDILFGPSWHGVILDTNPPDTDHWFYKLFEGYNDKGDFVGVPENHRIYHQPSGLADNAENIRHLPRNYYENMLHGKTQEWVNIYVHGKYGFVAEGKAVYPEYNDDTHYIDDVYVADSTKTVYIGIDFGLTPAALFGQITSSGAMVLFDELVTFDMGAVSFGKLLRAKMNEQRYKGCTFEVYGDPAGVGRAQSDESTPFMMLDKAGISAFPAYTNDPLIRREVVADYLMRLDFSAKPAFRIYKGAPMFRRGMNGGYCYKRLQVAGEERFQDVPDKSRYSHVTEAGQYLFLGAVGDDKVLGGYGKKDLIYSNKGIV
jgi:hypothetical protein